MKSSRNIWGLVSCWKSFSREAAAICVRVGVYKNVQFVVRVHIHMCAKEAMTVSYYMAVAYYDSITL